MTIDRRQFIATAAAGLLCPLAARAALAASPVDLPDGAILSFTCLGSIRTRTVYLDGHTTDGTVGLAPSRGGGFTGTAWRTIRLGRGVVALACLGDIDGPRWLDGRTREATVGLAPHTDEPYSGTAWRWQG